MKPPFTSILGIVSISRDLSVDGYYDSINELVGPNGVFFDPIINGYVVTGYETCRELLGNDELMGQPNAPHVPRSGPQDLTAHGQAILAGMLFFEQDRDNFIRRKRALMRAIAPHEQLRQRVAMLAKKHCDAIREEADGRPIDLYCHLRAYNLACSFEMVSFEGAIPAIVQRDILLAVALLDTKQFSRHFQDRAFAAIARLADWIAVNFHARALEELGIADLTMLIIAANESVAYLIFNVLKSSWARNEWLEVWNWSSDSCVEEGIRIDAPIQLLRRRAKEDFPLGRKTVRKGEAVYFHLGAANRDANVFSDPAVFRLGRPTNSIGFGIGLARCLGAGFATTCAKLFLEEFFLDLSCTLSADHVSYLHGLSGRGCLAAEATIRRY